MKKVFYLVSVVLFAGSLMLQSCSKDDDNKPADEQKTEVEKDKTPEIKEDNTKIEGIIVDEQKKEENENYVGTISIPDSSKEESIPSEGEGSGSTDKPSTDPSDTPSTDPDAPVSNPNEGGEGSTTEGGNQHIDLVIKEVGGIPTISIAEEDQDKIKGGKDLENYLDVLEALVKDEKNTQLKDQVFTINFTQTDDSNIGVFGSDYDYRQSVKNHPSLKLALDFSNSTEEEISAGLFDNSPNVVAIVFSENVKKIGKGAINSAIDPETGIGLKSVTLLNPTPVELDGVYYEIFNTDNKELTFYVPEASVEAYKAAWGKDVQLSGGVSLVDYLSTHILAIGTKAEANQESKEEAKEETNEAE